LAFVAGGAGVARAGLIFQMGNHPQPDEQNILLNAGTTGVAVFGETNKTHTTVALSSTTDILTELSNGQARIGAVDGLVNNITIAVPGGSSNGLVVNPFGGSGTATLTAIADEPGGGTQTFTFSYALGKGQNFVTIATTGGESIESLMIDAPGGFHDLRQPRISGLGVVLEPSSVVPEPSTVVMGSIALCLLGLIRMRSRRRTG
jgi:hypothetical protein